MKKSFFVMALAVMAMAMVSCSSDKGTPETSKTKLWPAQVANGEKWGYIDAKGNMTIAPQYDEANLFSCGRAVAWIGDKATILDEKGNFLTTPSFDYCNTYFIHDYLTILMETSTGYAYGLMDKKGNFTLQPSFYRIGSMGDNGLAYAMMSAKDEKYGYIDATGKFVINAMYDGVGVFTDGVAVVRMGDKWGAIDKSGKLCVNMMYDDLNSMGCDRLAFEQDGKLGMMDTKGNIIMQAAYADGSEFGDNGWTAAVMDGKNAMVMFYDKNGKVQMGGKSFAAAYPFYCGRAFVLLTEETEYYSVINEKGDVVFNLGKNEEPVYGIYFNGLTLVGGYSEKSGSVYYKYVDVDGKMVYQWEPKGNYNAPAKVAAKKDGKKFHDYKKMMFENPIK